MGVSKTDGVASVLMYCWSGEDGVHLHLTRPGVPLGSLGTPKRLLGSFTSPSDEVLASTLRVVCGGSNGALGRYLNLKKGIPTLRNADPLWGLFPKHNPLTSALNLIECHGRGFHATRPFQKDPAKPGWGICFEEWLL